LGNLAVEIIYPELNDLTFDLIEDTIYLGYVLVRNTGEKVIKETKKVWNLAEPIRKPVGKFSKSVKKQTIKGWNVIAPLVNPAADHVKNGTVAGWKFITPKIAKASNITVQGW
jgi:hypothetical protein